MHSTEDTRLDELIDRMYQDLCRSGNPKPADVLRWACGKFGDHPEQDPNVGRWFCKSFLPVARAAIGGIEDSNLQLRYAKRHTDAASKLLQQVINVRA